jgi:VanZ family protein
MKLRQWPTLTLAMRELAGVSQSRLQCPRAGSGAVRRATSQPGIRHRGSGLSLADCQTGQKDHTGRAYRSRRVPAPVRREPGSAVHPRSLLISRYISSLVIAGVSLTLTWVALTPAMPLDESALGRRLMDGAHLPAFAFLAAVVFYGRLYPRRSLVSPYLATLLVSSGAALLIESLQPITGRDARLKDLMHGWLGALVGTSGVFVWRERVGPGGRLAHAVMTLGALALVGWPAWTEWQLRTWREQHLPALGTFEDDAELKLWRPQAWSSGDHTQVELSARHVSAGQLALRVRTATGTSGGRQL